MGACNADKMAALNDAIKAGVRRAVAPAARYTDPTAAAKDSLPYTTS